MIRRLPREIVDRIAAGEVIERPASLVKELVENALDARARRIEVDLEKGGTDLLRVADDGTGIPFEELSLALASHATSKIADVGDLEHLASFGFRGEALASMAAVGRLRILSRPAGAETGGEIVAEAGKAGEPRPAASPPGTVVEVRDLFAFHPARRKFLRGQGTELGHGVEALLRLALPEEEVEFVLRHEGKVLVRLPAGLPRRERIREAFGRETAEALFPVAGEAGSSRVEGFGASPRLSRPDASRLYLFVNGRFVRDRALGRAVREAYREFLPEGRHPVAFLFLAVDPATVDPNVHPTKIEVRFRDARGVFSLVHRALLEGLRKAGAATPGNAVGPLARGEAPDRVAEPTPFDFSDVEAPAFRKPPLPTFVPDAASPPTAPTRDVPARYLQVHDTYLVRETEEGFEILDQHALHERVTLEELRAQFRRGAVESQRLLVPEFVETTRAEAALIESIAPALARAGLDVAPFGEGEVAIRAVPACLRRFDAKGVVADLCALASEGEAPDPERILEGALEKMACRASVMAGDRLEPQEIESLIRRGAALPHDATCAHARPTRVRFTLADLEKAFRRR
ncbi:MAG TPA: DNA mismatch repair endonuclease MutL [Planctomycetota bacterium]|jgi:DNA mismatch repair protein MutL|nr:DNA mismatch repair endonuclease MutL [Planctomycetota bacterium]